MHEKLYKREAHVEKGHDAEHKEEYDKGGDVRLEKKGPAVSICGPIQTWQEEYEIQVAESGRGSK